MLSNLCKNQCVMLVVIIGLFYIAYKGYCRYKGKGSTDNEEENEENEDTTKKLESDKKIDYDKIGRTVEEIMRKQI